MNLNGKEVCPRCENEKNTAALEQEESEKIRQVFANRKYQALQEKSILQDKTLLNAKFDSYVTKTHEEMANKQKAIGYFERYCQGQMLICGSTVPLVLAKAI